MIKIVLISHGFLAQSMVQTVEMVMGKQNNIAWIALDENMGIAAFRQEIERVLGEVPKGEQAVIVSDIYFGSPFNTLMEYLAKHPALENRVITGMNLPMLIELCVRSRSEGETLEKIAAEAAFAGTEGIRLPFEIGKNEIIEEEEQEL